MNKGWEIVRDLQLKFNYAFTSLVFATLALSIQFSPRPDADLPWFLIAGWIQLFISGVLMGIRIIYTPVFFGHRNAEFDLRDASDQMANAKSIGQRVIHPETGEDFTPERLDAAITLRKNESGELKLKGDRLQKLLPWLFNGAVILFLTGVLAIGVFTSVNFLGSSR